MKNKFLLLITIAMLSFAQANAVHHNNGTTTKTSISSGDYCGVTAADIYRYMLDQGYTVVTCNHIPGSCDALVTTTAKIDFQVHISNGFINGFDESNM